LEGTAHLFLQEIDLLSKTNGACTRFGPLHT
jgi:hypothetical protein